MHSVHLVFDRPPPSVLAAFGAGDVPVRYPMGRGGTWRSDAIVLKRVEDDQHSRWLADLAARVEQRGFRVARPIRARDGRWVVDGWSAWHRADGEHSTTRWPELLAAASAFHAAIRDVPRPAWIARTANRWRLADRVAWGETPPGDLRAVTHVAPLLALRRPISLPSQLVHGDLVGNVLFAEGKDPAIIDLSLYWRPAGYSAALVVGDALTWEGASRDILGLLEQQPEWPQLLLRAVLFRIVVNELARRAEPERADLSAEYVAVVDLVRSLVPL